MSKYVIFGAGPAGLYSAWRLLTSDKVTKGDVVQLVEWGDYAFPGTKGGTRNPAGRICSHHYQGDTDQSYIEVGGMRYIEWDGKSGHQLVTKTISALGLDPYVIDFNTTENPLFYLRGTHFYQNDLNHGFEAPYKAPGVNQKPADDLFADISARLIGDQVLDTRDQQCEFYASGTLPADFASHVYAPGQTISNIGYWNVFLDQISSEAYEYAADAGGYSSNVINWNAANAAVYNGEFAPGGAFKTLSIGYSALFSSLFAACQEQAGGDNATLEYIPKTRLHSIWSVNNVAHYRTASASDPDIAASDIQTADAVFLAMPPQSIELVGRATRYHKPATGVDVLNDPKVRNYLESVILQPSYKVAMFFDRPWWEDSYYAPKLVNAGQHNQNVFGPTVTDLPLRQIYYFGNNAPKKSDAKVYGLLAAYDDMRFTKFWQGLELSPDQRQETATSQNYQPLIGPGAAPEVMENMLLLELAQVHYGTADAMSNIPKPLETKYMDWGLNPFGAGYHAWNAHYNICDVMQKIRTPGRMAGEAKSNIFIVGSAFSNDQAWVEGAFTTAESVLEEFLGLSTFVNAESTYPLICRKCGVG